ncbi:MAG: hypothetical protein IKH33_04675, partial [Bacteroidales bacterium]|nr:hypothetical protein [Bacteroidales bacterium]
LGKSNFLQDFWISAVGGEMHFTVLRQALKRGKISPASRNREILGKSNFLQDFWISAVGGEMHFTVLRQALKRGKISPASRNREILGKSNFLQDFWISAAGGEIIAPQKLISHVTKESLFLKKEGVSGIFLRKKFVMSLFRIIFAFENGREECHV